MIALESLVDRDDYEILVGKYPEQVVPEDRLRYVKLAARQYREKGRSIGRRQTPVFSRWSMKPKWEKFLPAWTYVAYSGCNEMVNGRLCQPAIIRLVYLQVPSGEIVQLAYELCGEIHG